MGDCLSLVRLVQCIPETVLDKYAESLAPSAKLAPVLFYHQRYCQFFVKIYNYCLTRDLCAERYEIYSAKRV